MRRFRALSNYVSHALIVWWAGVTFVYANRYEYVDLATVLYFYASILLLSAFFTFIGFKIFPNRKHQVGFCIPVGLFIMFLTPSIRELLDPFIQYRYTLMISLILFVIVCVIATRLSQQKTFHHLSIIFFILPTIPTCQMLYFKVFQGRTNSYVIVPLKAQAVITPNVYFIVLDGYPRADTLKKVLDFDNSEFLSFLQNNNFHIADTAYAAYADTNHSIVTTFRMNYATTFEPYLKFKRFDGVVFENFRKLGYQIFYMPHKPNLGLCPTHVTCFYQNRKSAFLTIGRLEMALIKTVPLLEELLINTGAHLFNYMPNEITHLHNSIESLDKNTPYFFYGHVEMPHAPYLRDENCKAVDYKSIGLIDAFQASARINHTNFLICGNSQVKNMIQMLVEKDPNSIVIIQSDHGSYFVNYQYTGITAPPIPGTEPWKKLAFEEAYGILSAIRVPKTCNGKSYSSTSPINTFRMIFACLTKTNPIFLPEKSFWFNSQNNSYVVIRENGKWHF